MCYDSSKELCILNDIDQKLVSPRMFDIATLLCASTKRKILNNQTDR